MPRRTFFRSASEKKTARKHQKYDQKLRDQQQQQQLQLRHRKEKLPRHQQARQGQADGLQASTSTNGSDPPLNLSGPARTAPRYASVGDRPYTSDDPNYISVDLHEHYGQTRENHGHHPAQHHHYQDRSSEVHQNTQQEQQQEQYYLNGGVPNNYEQLHQQQYVTHEGQGYVSQSEHQHLSTQQEQDDMEQKVPTVESATDQMWQCETGDFRSGSLAIQLLRLAVVTDWEKRQQNAETDVDQLLSFPYDPSETFLSLQGAALRFHANFELKRAGRDAYAREAEGPDSLEWELTEQTAWEVWEESLRASAALAHASVGPGWRYQLQLRRRLNHESEMRSLYGPSLPQRSHVVFDDYSDGGSSLGSNSFDISNPQSSHYSRGLRQTGTDRTIPNAVAAFRIIIPEVLPAAMIRFAASAIDSAPRLYDPQSKIVWEDDQTQQQMQSIILQHINKERRWIRRMKRLGDAQRDLTFALCCVGGSVEQNQDTADQSQELRSQWSIPRGHMPMATMICSWLTCSTIGWPVAKKLDEVPYHYEEVTSGPLPSDGVVEPEELSDAPPNEIAFPVQKPSATQNEEEAQHGDTSETTNEHTSGVQIKFSYWNDLVSLSSKDWWYTLRVLRDCSDLVSSGWRPPPSDIGFRICSLLVQIALEGDVMPSSFNADSRKDDVLPDEEICRESCAAESLALLKNLASRDVLPLQSVDMLATSLCRLLTTSEKAISDLESNNATFEDEIVIQRTFVASNSAELLWILLSTESTCCPTCDALLNLIDGQVSQENQNAAIDETGATSAVRALSAALWGDPPSVQGVPLLRYFWEYVVSMFGKVLSVHAMLCSRQSISLALEIVLALRRLIDSEMVYGNGDLHPTEWESFIDALDIGISPWLCSKTSLDGNVELLEEINSLFVQLQRFLDKVPEIDHGFHPIVDEEARNMFHTHLLRKCVPRLKAEVASNLGLAIIKAWSCSIRCNLPCRDGKWLKQATSFISEAFAKYDGPSKISFPGGYVHSPLVRLEALQSLLSDHGHTDQHASDLASVATSISAVTSGTGLSGAFIPMLSLFTLTRNQRDLHLGLINKLLLPQLLEILAPEFEIKGILSIPKRQIPSYSSEEHESFDHLSEYAEFLLLKFATRVIGLLFKSRSGDGENRVHFIRLLRHLALTEPHVLLKWNASAEQFLNENLELETFQLQLEAIRQLEVCLRAPFLDLPHTHGTVPTILNGLCDIVAYYSLKQEANSMKRHTNSILCLAALLPLTRLSCTRNGQGIFLPRELVTSNIPHPILNVLDDDGWIESCDTMIGMNQSLPMVLEEECLSPSNGDDIAPFVYVKQCPSHAKDDSSGLIKKEETKKRLRRHSSERCDQTIVDVEPVARIIKDTLCAYVNRNIEPQHEEGSQVNLSTIIRLVCFKAISSFLSHGISSPNPLDDTKWLQVETESIEESTFRSEAVSLLATMLGKVHLSKRLKIDDQKLLNQTCEVLVGLAIEQADNPTVTKNACCGLVSLLASTKINETKGGQDMAVRLPERLDFTETLTPLIQYTCQLFEHHSCLQASYLIPLINVTRTCITCSIFANTRAICQRILHVCLKLDNNLPWHLQVIVFFMGAEVIDFMSREDLVLYLTLGYDINHSRIQPLLLDVLRSKILYKNHTCLPHEQASTVSRKPFEVHKELARKTIALEKYQFQTKDGVAAWKCGSNLLTIRIGSNSSLYRGWAEIVLRSASCNLRRLVRIDKGVSSTNPDNLLSFWSLLKSLGTEDMPSKKSIVDNQNMRLNSKRATQCEKREKIFAEARTIMDQFDQIIQSGDHHKNDNDLLISKSTMLDSEASSFSSEQSDHGRFIDPTFEPRRLKRNSSDGNIAHRPVEPRTTDMLLKNEVKSWMTETFSEYFDCSTILRELQMLGFSNRTLGSISKLRYTCSQEIHHEKLEPCAIGTNFTRALNILDRSTPFQTHRVSLLYGGPLSQKAQLKPSNSKITDGDQFLMTTQASTDFWEFAKELGDLVPVRHLRYFSGGLDTSESSSDGSFAFVWFGCNGRSNGDNVASIVDSMVMFHTVTLMPNKITNRKRHIGNDIVHIVYGLESETLDVDHERLVISGHFGLVTLYVIPFACTDMVKISIHLKKGLDESICSALSHLVGNRFVSRKISAETVRQLAIEADLICLSMLEEKLGLVLNIEERALKINDMHRHLRTT